MVAWGQAGAWYEGLLSDGTRVAGDDLSGWHDDEATPKLAGVALRDAKRRLRWLRNLSVAPYDPNGNELGCIEFVNGDRLVGRLVGWRPGGEGEGGREAAHLLVKLPMRFDASGIGWRGHARVLPDQVRRVMWGPPAGRAFAPGTLHYRNGRWAAFLGLRWRADSVLLLLAQGTRDVPLAQIAEIHMPPRDPWPAYCEELAVLSPACRSRLVRLATGDGLVVTTSELRLRPLSHRTAAERQRAIEHLKRIQDQIARIRAQPKRARQSLDDLRRNLERRQAEARKKLEAARPAHEKAVPEAGPERKEWDRQDAAKWTARRKQLVEQHRRATASHEKKLAKLTGAARAEAVKAFRKTTTSHKEKLKLLKSSADRVAALERDLQKLAGEAKRLAIRMRWSFAPTAVPLSRVRPVAAVSRSVLGSVSPPRADCNVNGEALCSGGQRYGWGFGVHAYSELRFDLPAWATAFRSRVGLDGLVGPGGCVRARVFASSVRTPPLYASGLLIGSDKTLDTGPLLLPAGGEGAKQLILQVDPAHRGRPAGADPFNIRDMLNWLDPELELDAAALRKEVRRCLVRQTAAWRGWTVRFDPAGTYTWTTHFAAANPPGTGAFVTMIRADRKPLVLTRTRELGPTDRWVIVDVDPMAGGPADAEAGGLRVDGRPVRPRPVPPKREWQPTGAPLLFPLAAVRGKKVSLELTQPAAGKPLHWRSARVADQPPAPYRLADILQRAGQGDLEVSRPLGWALQSATMGEEEKLAVLEIHRLGGVVNFWHAGMAALPADELSNVLIPAGWTGGQAGLAIAEKLPRLKTLYLAADAGIGRPAAAKLAARMPKLKIVHLARTPSPQGAVCHFRMRNHGDEPVTIYWVNHDARLVLPREIKPHGEGRLRCMVGCRYEAHRDGKVIDKYVVAPDGIWEIKQP